MTSFRFVLLSLCLCLCAQTHAAARMAVPNMIADNNNPVVYLPDNPVEATNLLHLYNAQASGPRMVVPSIEEIVLRAKQDNNDQSWLATIADIKTEEFPDLYFPIRSAPTNYTGALVLILPDVPAADSLREQLQRFVSSTWLANGHAQKPHLTPTTGFSIKEGVSAIAADSGIAKLGLGECIMIAVGLLLLFLGIKKGFEPLLLVPIAVGCILVNATGAEMMAPAVGDASGGLLWYFYHFGIESGIFPLLIFLGVGSLTDFGPLLANPWSALLGGAAQFGIFGSFLMAVIAWHFFYGDNMTFEAILREAGAIAIIGGADGPTSIFVAQRLAPHLLGAIAVAAYSYMALVPMIQPPVMRALTTAEERKIMMTQRKEVSSTVRIFFPIAVILICILLLPSAVPLIGMLMLGNLMRECGVVDRLTKTAQNELINITTIALGLAVGSKLNAHDFLNAKTLLILSVGIVAFCVGTAAGVTLGKILNKLSGGKINPLIGAAGVSAVPMAARVAHVEGQRYNKQNALLMHAMGPNVAGVIGSAVAAGILLALLG